MLRAALALLVIAPLFAQEQRSKADLLLLADQLEAATMAGDWKTAAELSSLLKQTVAAQRNRSLSVTANEEINTIIKWLPEDTETIAIAQQPFTLPPPDAGTPSDAIASARGYVLLPFYERHLAGRTLKFAAIAARRFANHQPETNGALPLGLIAYEGCGFYAFAQPTDESALPAPQTSILGHPIREEKAEDQGAAEPESFFTTLLKTDMMISYNDREFLTQVLSRIDGPQPAEAFPSLLQEWKQVDRTKPLWALRHFRQERAHEDPSFPDNDGLFAGYNVVAPIGVVLSVDGPDGKVTARFISSSPDNPWEELAKAGDFNGHAETKRVAPGVWEISAPADMESGMFAIFALMAVLGFVVLL